MYVNIPYMYPRDMESVQKSEQRETHMNHEVLIGSLRDPYNYGL